ncbi:multicopper oxidase-domain-containing protein [Dipodascopsis uninucleata]
MYEKQHSRFHILYRRQLLFVSAAVLFVLGSLFWLLPTYFQRTPKVIEHTIVLRREHELPTGRIQMNGDFMGPILRAQVGDTLKLTIDNQLPEGESTSIHMHGLRQIGSNVMDGVPGVTQCGIPSGDSFTYAVKLTESGTFWWHSHSNTQLADGLSGALVVTDRRNEYYILGRDYIDEIVVFFQDHYQNSGEDMFQWYLSRSSTGFEPVPDYGTINGGNHTRYALKRRHRYRVRVIHAGAFGDINFSIDGHALTVIEADATEVKPVHVQSAKIAPGQRYSFMINAATAGPSSIEMHADLVANTYNYHNVNLDSKVSAHIDLIGQTIIDSTIEGPLLANASETLGERMLVPAIQSNKTEVPRNFDQRLIIASKTMRLDRVNLAPFGFINRTSYVPAIGAPNILVGLGIDITDAAEQTPKVPTVSGKSNTPKWGGDQLVIELERDKVVELVINNPDEMAHPFHLHGHDLFVVDSHSAKAGIGKWKPDYESNYKFENLIPRDTIVVPRYGYSVVRFKTDNPGFWALHCHILWHMRAGMMIQLAVAVENIDKTSISQTMRDQCQYEREHEKPRTLPSVQNPANHI